MAKPWHLFLFFLFPIIASAQIISQDLHSKRKAILPGTTTSIPFTIINNSNERLTYQVSFISSAPSFITPILTQQKISVAPESNFLYIVPIRVSSGALKGTYKIKLKLWNKKTRDKFIKASTIRVTQLKKVKLTRIAAPNYLRAGQTIKASFLLTNGGNTTERLYLESNASIVDSINRVVLHPGDGKVIYVHKNIPTDLAKNDIYTIRLLAISAVDSTEQWSAYSNTSVIATHPKEKDPYFRFPITASIGYLGMRNNGRYQGGFQAEIYGKGSLNNQKTDQLMFHIVTPNPIRYTSFSKFERYGIAYKNEHLYVHLGDKAYSSSYLTEFNRFGRGAEIHYTFDDKLTIGGFYNHPRFYGGIKDEFNVFSSLKLKNETKITAGYLYKILKKSSDGFGFSAFNPKENTHLPYFVVESQPFKNLNILAGGAYSKSKHTKGYAYRIRMSGYFKNLRGGFQYLHASPEFNGYYNNTTSLNANLRYQISERFYASGYYTQSARNKRHDTLFLSAPYHKSYRLGIAYQYLEDGRVSLFAGKRRYEDRMMPKQFDYSENFIRLGIDQRIAFFNLGLEGQFGKTTNFLTDATGNSQYYTANLSFQKFRTSFSFYGSYANTSRYRLKNQEQFYYGARIRSHFSENSYLSVYYRNNYQPEAYYRNRNLFQLTYHQQIFPGSSIELSGRYALQQGRIGDKDFLFSLRYILRLDVPVQKVAEYTTLSGRIINEGVTEVGGIRLRLGNNVTVTDALGNFIFKNVVPGNYFLSIDRSTTALHAIPTIELPTPIKLTEQKNSFNFGLTTAATIQGMIKVERREKKSEIGKLLNDVDEGHNRIIVEVTNGKQTYRKLCPINAPFDFTYLRPGNWTVKVYRNGLDKRYEVLTDSFQLTLQPAETKKVEIKVAKKQMNIQYQQEEIKISYGN